MTSRNNRFTPAERKALHNKDFFYIKASATKKIDILLAGVRDEIKSEIKKKKLLFPEEADASAGKIFKGENYAGLPYMVLDFPKYFTKESVFSFRTMCWWGNFFSFTLHLQGKALEEYRAGLTPSVPARAGKGEGGIHFLKKRNINICVNNNPWQYHFEKDNYIPVDKLSDRELEKILLEKEFIKISRKIPLKDYKTIVNFATKTFQYLYPERG